MSLDLVPGVPSPSFHFDGPAYVTNQRHRIVHWNHGAEEALGKRAAEVMGRSCHEVVKSRDFFGNRFCYNDCPITAMARAGEMPRAACVFIPQPEGADKQVDLTVHVVPGATPGEFSLVHLLGHHDTTTPSEMPADTDPDEEPPLTTREKEILQRIATGIQNKEIAHELHISHATVRNHIRNILAKLEVHSKLEAVSLAFRCRWIGPNGDGRYPALVS
jgi:DNA-binding CsgD family transcriptional regulator